MKRLICIVLSVMGFAIAASAQSPENTLFGSTDGSSELYFHKGYIYKGETVISDHDLKVLLPLNLYQQASGGLKMHRQGRQLIIAGSVLGGIGLIGLAASGIALVTVDEQDLGLVGTSISSLVFSSGVTCLGVGIPFYVVGRSRASRASASYNALQTSQQVSFNFGSTRNGTGLFINF